MSLREEWEFLSASARELAGECIFEIFGDMQDELHLVIYSASVFSPTLWRWDPVDGCWMPVEPADAPEDGSEDGL